MFGSEFNSLARFHHFGLAVKSLEAPSAFYKVIGYACSAVTRDELQGADLVFCRSVVGPDIELVKPVDESSPVNGYLKHSDEMIYHTCYEVDSLEKVLELIRKQARVLQVNEPKSAVLFSQKPVSFYYVKGVGLVEFLEK